MVIGGLVMYMIGKKTEAPKLKELEEERLVLLDEMMLELHGQVPGKK